MKLPPYIVPFVKDAVKAVKQICHEEFKEVVDETLTELPGIAALVVRMYAIRREGEHEVLHLWCAHREEIALCTHCGSLSTALHQEEHRCIRSNSRSYFIGGTSCGIFEEFSSQGAILGRLSA